MEASIVGLLYSAINNSAGQFEIRLCEILNCQIKNSAVGANPGEPFSIHKDIGDVVAQPARKPSRVLMSSDRSQCQQSSGTTANEHYIQILQVT